MMSLVFIGTPEFAVPSLRALHAAGHEILAVVTQPDRPAGRGRKVAESPVKVAALDLGLTVLQPATLRAPGVADHLRDLAPDVMVVVAYGEILRPDFLAIPHQGVLNVHAALLPRWRGASPIPAAILAGDGETGVTIMLMDEGMDTGPILSQAKATITDDDTTATLTESLADLGASLLARTLPQWLSNDIKPQPQDNSLATITRTIKKDDGLIDWWLSADDIWRRVRAYDPWPGARTSLGGEPVTIWRAWPVASPTPATAPGTVLPVPGNLPAEAESAGFAVQTGDGLLAVLEAQRAGRKRLPGADLLRGMPDLIGNVLG